MSNWNFRVPGLSLHDELARLVDAGLSPIEALQTATINPVTHLGVEDTGVKIEWDASAPRFSCHVMQPLDL